MRAKIPLAMLALLAVPLFASPAAAGTVDVAYYQNPVPGYAPASTCTIYVYPTPGADCPPNNPTSYYNPDYMDWIEVVFPFSSSATKATVKLEDSTTVDVLFHILVGEGGKYQKSCVGSCVVTESTFWVSVSPWDWTTDELAQPYSWNPPTTGKIVVAWG